MTFDLKSFFRTFGFLSFCLLLLVTVNTNAQMHTKSAKPKTQTARVLIAERGFSRTRINLRRGVRTRITFLRQTDATCATEIVILDYGIRRSLPLNVPAVVSFTPKRSGEVSFACGMNMMHGKLIVL